MTAAADIRPERPPANAEWRETTLGEFAPFVYGKGLLKSKRNPNGGVPVYGSNGVIGFHDEALTAGPTIIIGRKGTMGAVHYSPVPCWPIDTTFFVEGDDAELARFKYYAMSVLNLKEMNSDTAVPGLNRNSAHALEMRVPSESEQRRISAALGALDDKIALNARMNETLDEMAGALFRSWFVDFAPVRAKISGAWRRGESLPCLPAALYDLFPDALEASALGETPAGWEVKGLGYLAEAVGGGTPSTKEPAYWEGGRHCFATPKDLSKLSTFALMDTERQITDEGLAKISSGLLPVGSVLLSSRAPIGYLAINEVPVAVNQGFIALKPKPSVSNLFLLYAVESLKAEIVNHANGTTFPEISKRNFRPIPTTLPDPSVMSAFDAQARALYDKIVANERESRALAAIRDTLLPKLLSGEASLQG